MAFRITPSLGPDVEQVGNPFYWQMDEDVPSYQLGSVVRGSDGHEYVFVEAGAAFDADDVVTVNLSTWVATANAGGSFEAPVAVASGAYFHARRISEGFEDAT